MDVEKLKKRFISKFSKPNSHGVSLYLNKVFWSELETWNGFDVQEEILSALFQIYNHAHYVTPDEHYINEQTHPKDPSCEITHKYLNVDLPKHEDRLHNTVYTVGYNTLHFILLLKAATSKKNVFEGFFHATPDEIPTKEKYRWVKHNIHNAEPGKGMTIPLSPTKKKFSPPSL